MNSPILNREFQHPADGWYQIEAKGQHPHRAAGVVQVIDDTAAQSIVNRFNEAAAAGTLRHGSEMLIDHEHFSDQPDQETRAYGWLTKLANRDDGIYGQIRWTATGKPAVDGGDYRFFSTEYDPQDVKMLNKEAKQVRPLRLSGLTLTNMNNNRGQKPITNRDKNFPGAGAPGDSQPTNTNKKMKSVCTALGLSPDAAEDVVLAEVNKLKNRGEITPAELTTLRNRDTTMTEQNQTLLGEQCEALMDAHGIKADDKAKRDKLKPVLIGLKNREDRVAFLKECVPAPAAQTQQRQQTQLRNRDTSAPGTTAAVDKDDEAGQQALTTKIKNRATELKGSAPSRSFDSCWAQAKQELTKTV